MKKFFRNLQPKTYNLKPSKGAYLPVILVASTLFLAYAVAIVSISLANIKVAKIHNSKITSMSIAEAGINYYMWHMSHDNKDYCDGHDDQTCTGPGPYGPYKHDYMDQYGNVVGTYELTITPPTGGGNSATIKSTGRVDDSTPKRTIVAELGIPSFTRFTLMVGVEQLWLGSSEKVTGSVHVNYNGMFIDGEITGDASSTETTYDSWFGSNMPGVAGPGIFGGAKLFPVPAVDFAQLDVDIKNLRDNAKILDEGYFDNSGKKGYHIILGDNSYDLYKVSKYNNTGYDIITETVIDTYPYPSDGIIFFEDNLWVEGKINNQRITILAADPEANSGQKKGMYIPNPILYTNYDGTDTIGLITQKNIFVTRNAPFDMEIDAAMIAKEGKIMIEQYGILKGNMRVYGSMAHNTGLVWTYGNPDTKVWSSGYVTTETIIDENNVLSPPPQFPTTGAYSVLSWREE